MTTEVERIDHSSSQRNFCRDLARTNLAACFMFLELAKRELETGMRGQAERFFGRARRSYEATLQLLDRVENERSAVQKRVEWLGGELDFLRQELNQAA